MVFPPKELLYESWLRLEVREVNLALLQGEEELLKGTAGVYKGWLSPIRVR